MDSRDEHKLITELDDFLKLVTGKEWLQFVKLMQVRKSNLQKKINSCLRDGDHRQADRTQAKLEDVDHIFNLVKSRIDYLKKGGK